MIDFARYANWIAAAILIVVMEVLRQFSQHAHFRRELRGSQVYLICFLAVDLLQRLIPPGWDKVDRVAGIVGTTLFVFGAIRGAASVLFHIYRVRRHVEIPRILRDIADGALFLIAVTIILGQTGVAALTALVPATAVLSLVLGLALQETLGNVFAGLSLQGDRPFSEGDFIKIGNHTGRVIDVGWRSTHIVTGTGEMVTVPNNIIAKDAIYNLSRRGAVLRKVIISIGYDTPPNDFKDLAIELLRTHPRIARDPKPGVRAAEFGPGAITYELLFWVARYEDSGPVEDDVRTQLWYRLHRAEISVQHPTTTIQLRRGKRVAAQAVDIESLLTRAQLLAGIDAPTLKRIASHSSVLRFGRGEVLLREGEPTESPFFVIADGEVTVMVQGSDGRDREVARLGRGEFFGEMAALTGAPRTASVVASRDTLAVAVDRADLGELLQQFPQIAQALADVLARRREALDQVTAAPGTPAPIRQDRQRILARLKELFRGIPGSSS
jgi:small-conductance mechanosensitive channel/CRP-like cAMP-binding protein